MAIEGGLGDRAGFRHGKREKGKVRRREWKGEKDRDRGA